MTSVAAGVLQGAGLEQPQAAFHPDQLHLLFGGMHKGMAYCRMEYTADAPSDFTVLYANAAFGTLCDQADVLNQRIGALLSGSSAIDESLLNALNSVLGQGVAHSFERYVQVLGKWLQIDAHRTNPGHFILILSDVSDKRRAEGELAESEKRLRAIFHTCPVPFCLNDTAGNITFLNRAFQETFGYTVEDIPTLEAWWPRAYPDPVYREWVGQTWLDKVEKARREGSEFETMEAVIQCKDGSLRTVLADAVPMGEAFADIHLVVLYDFTDQKQAAISLAEAERYAQRLLDSVGDGLCQVNAQGEITFINPCGADLLGYTSAELIGQHAHTLFHHSRADGSAYPESEYLGHKAILQGSALSVDNEVFWRKDGSSFAVQYTSAPMEVGGEAQGQVLTFRDISEEQRIRKALLDNEIVMRKAQEIAGFGTYVLDLRSGLWESSPQLDALFGIGPDFVRDVSGWSLLVDEEFRANAEDHFHLVSIGKMDFRLDYRITRPSDGAKRWVAGNGEVEFDAQGKPLRLIGSIQDISRRKRIEAELQESHDLLQKLSKELPGVLYQFKMTPDGSFIVPFASMGAQDMFGFGSDAVRQDATRVFEAIVPEARDAFARSIQHSARTLENWVEEFQVELPGVGRRWRQGQARPELLDDGSVVWYGFINDATERVESRRQLQLLNENLELHVLERTRELVVALDSAELAKSSRGQFLANVSHEIRTPMNAIIGMVYMLLQNNPTEQQRKYLEKVQQSGEHLLGIINDILDFSKIDVGKLQLDLQSTDLAQLLHQVVHMSEGKATEKGLHLTLDISPAVPRYIRCDALRLGQILINFLNNASKFTERGHIILRVTVAQAATQHCPQGSIPLRFEVEDTGIGMNAEQLTRLFQSFMQGDNSTTRKFGGTGLGLAISRELAYLMGGEVGAHSTPDAGSTFWFACGFEVTQELAREVERVTEPVQASVALRGKRVLVVDDNAFNLDVASDLLSGIGMQVEVASNGLQALEILSQQRFELVLMDVQMPVMDGHEATRRIRANAALASTVVIAMTANASLEDRSLCLQAGMDDVLTKPINPEKMFHAIARWTGASTSMEEAAPVAPLPATAGDLLKAQPLPVWDALALQRIVGASLVHRDRLLGKYLQTAGETVDAIRHAAVAGQWPVIAELAHKLKSSSRSVGAMQLGAFCEALERAGSGSNCQTLAALVVQGFAEAQARIQARAR